MIAFMLHTIKTSMDYGGILALQQFVMFKFLNLDSKMGFFVKTGLHLYTKMMDIATLGQNCSECFLFKHFFQKPFGKAIALKTLMTLH